MTPPIEEWPASELPVRVYTALDGRRRKLAGGVGGGGGGGAAAVGIGGRGSGASGTSPPEMGPDGTIDLARCPLYEMVQYACEPQPVGAGAKQVIRCEPLVRTFRKCQQFMAEITALREGEQSRGT